MCHVLAANETNEDETMNLALTTQWKLQIQSHGSNPNELDL